MGLFGSSAPRRRTLTLDQERDMLAAQAMRPHQQPIQTQAPPGMIGGAAPKKRGGGIAGLFGYDPETAGMNANEWWWSDPIIREKRAESFGKQKQQEAINQQLAQIEDPEERMFAMLNPEAYGQAMSGALADQRKTQTQTFFDPSKNAWNEKPEYMNVAPDNNVFSTAKGGSVYTGPPKPQEDYTLGPDQYRFGPDNNVVARGPPGRDASSTAGAWRPATEAEAANYGPAGTRGQINTRTGQFSATSRPNIQSGGLPTESERKFGLYAANADKANRDIDAIEYSGGFDKPETFDRGGASPFYGPTKQYDQALDRFLDSWARAMTGAAMTKEEKDGYYSMLRPAFGDDANVRRQKAIARHEMAEQLKVAGARGFTAQQNADQPPPDDGPVQIASDEEFDALPSGAEFIDPDGNIRIKP